MFIKDLLESVKYNVLQSTDNINIDGISWDSSLRRKVNFI